MPTNLRTVVLSLVLTLLVSVKGAAQRYLADYDSSLFVKDTLRPLIDRFHNLSITGYMQPQFQVAEAKGINSYAGGDFPEQTNNRFMIRRARVKLDYKLPGKEGKIPAALFTFQFEATERDVNVRDMFVRIFEPKGNNFSLSAGLFARPFGYEVNLSSSYRETPERGRMSQILMPSERDLGAMVSFEPQKIYRGIPMFKFDIGLFNGQGKSGPREFDSYKDLISRLTFKPYLLRRGLEISGGLSFLSGGWAQATKYRYEMNDNLKEFKVDSSITNIGAKADRSYYGADVQLALNHGWGKTEWRGEYWRGTQPGTSSTTENPGELPLDPTYIRNFDGAFFYFLQNIINKKWELVIKYDWYDPNTKVSGMDIGAPGHNLTAADIKYSTLGIGMTHYFTDHVKVLAYYDFVTNESTSLTGNTSDINDNVFTLRMQFRF